MRLSFHLSLVALSAAALAIACSSSIGNGPGNGAGGNGSSSGGGSGSSSGASPGGADASAGSDASVGTTSSSGGVVADSGPGVDDSSASSADSSGSSSGGTAKLYPLAVGYTWTYAVAAVGAGSTCTPGTQVQQVTGTQTVDGRQAFDVSSFCAAVGTSELAPAATGDEVDYDYSGTWLELVDPTLVAGTTWTYYDTSFTWVSVPSITVPAGTYTDCWTAQQNVSYTAYTTYCRGVGPVRSYSADLTGAGWDAQLASKSF
jgi:hypothetical protein